jgi:hypothetical protein
MAKARFGRLAARRITAKNAKKLRAGRKGEQSLLRGRLKIPARRTGPRSALPGRKLVDWRPLLAVPRRLAQYVFQRPPVLRRRALLRKPPHRAT